MARGDHIRVWRGGYWHHGVDVGNGQVIHYTGEVLSKQNAAVKKTTHESFAAGSSIDVVRYRNASRVETVVRRAHRRLGERRYQLAFNNCEHFARWCKTGEHRSEQVKDAASTAGGAVGSGAATAGALGTVSALGAVAGLSGPGVMSGLATVGGVVGGGAVAGLGALAVAPAAVTTLAMRNVLADDARLPKRERKARKAGRLATAAGGAAGTAGALGAVAVAGVPGLSAAGITSGLAAIGGALGGGMVAGAAVTIAAPAAAAAAIGYGIYRWFK